MRSILKVSLPPHDAPDDNLKKVIAHAEVIWLCFPLAANIYATLSAVYDYGAKRCGTEEQHQDLLVELHDVASRKYSRDHSAIFMHPTIWKASGHVDAFGMIDIIDNKDSRNATGPMY